MDAPAALAAISRVVEEFFGAFTSGPDIEERLDRLRTLMLPQAVIIQAGGAEPEPYGVDEFINPRRALLTSGHLLEFEEWPESGQTDIFGDIAHHSCVYAKRGIRDGTPFEGRGVKSLQ